MFYNFILRSYLWPLASEDKRRTNKASFKPNMVEFLWSHKKTGLSYTFLTFLLEKVLRYFSNSLWPLKTASASERVQAGFTVYSNKYLD